MKIFSTLTIFFALSWTGVSHPACASDSDLPTWLADQITPVHYGLTRFVDSTSRSVDRFFGTDDSLFVENQSFLRVGQEGRFLSRSLKNEYDTSVRFRLDLPTTKRRLRVIFESDFENPARSLPDQGIDRFRSTEQINSSNSALGLERKDQTDNTTSWDGSFGAGVKFRSPVDPYVRYTATRQWRPENSPWQINAYSRITLFDRQGSIARATWDANRPIAQDRSLRFLTQVEWQEQRNSTLFSQSAEINRVLDNRTALRYALIAVGDSANQPDLLDYVAQIYYRRDLHKGFLFADVIPEVHFPQIAGSKPYIALTVRLEIFFHGDFARKK